MLKSTPAVFAMGHNYHIMVSVNAPVLMWVKVGNAEYYDELNGIMRSSGLVRKAVVPMEALDAACQYTVCLRPVLDRKPYFTDTADVIQYTFNFHPVPASDVRMFHISDAHHRTETPIAAAKTFGTIDALILNGDLLNYADDPADFNHIFDICDAVTHGSIPIVFARGNHDMRGAYAEHYATYAPYGNSTSYYTFRLGSIWGMVLDCGEDKPDDHKEYGFTVMCHPFRMKQTAFIRSVIAHSEEEYRAPGVKTRLIICHNPFVKVLAPPFDIERDLYTEWIHLLTAHINPHAMISGHLHRTGVQFREQDGDLPFPCPLIIGSRPSDDTFEGCGITVTDNDLKICFTDSLGAVTDTVIIPK